MNDKSSLSDKTQVVLIKGNTPRETISEGISKLGGITKFIDNGDKVFIKINLKYPNAFPTNTNLEVIQSIISLCKDAGATEIYVGSFPSNQVDLRNINDFLDLYFYLKQFGAQLLFLDNEKDNPREIIDVNNKEFKIPSVILKCDKMISINQVNVDPLFYLTINLLNSYSLVPEEFQEIYKKVREGKDYLHLDQYKKDLLSNIIDVFTIKKPDLVINDLFYVLEGAGPCIYKDSKLKKPKIMIIGSDSVAVDTITLKILNIDPDEHSLLLEARDKNVGTYDFSKIELVGESLENCKLDIEFCVSKLEDIGIMNTNIERGRLCSGCFNQAYHLLNLMKSNMTKDLKYITQQSLLLGEKPPEPESLENLLIFGDCAINSTQDRSFRKIRIAKGKKSFKEIKNKIIKKNKQKPKEKIKIIPNKKILELPGCPPNILKCVYLILKYYGEDKVPGLNLYYNLVNTFINREKIEALIKED